MKKMRRILIGWVVTGICFFTSMLVSSYTNPSAEVFHLNTQQSKGTPAPSPTPTEPSGNSIIPVSSTPTPLPSLTPTVSPTSTVSPTPTMTPTPTVSPTPTLSPTPTVSPTPTLSPTPTVSPTPTPIPLVLNFTMPAVSTNLHIRKGPGTGYDIIGKLPIMTYAYILEKGDNGWTKISTGSIEEGYVSSDYLFSQEEIISLCDREELVFATTTAGLNLRTGPGTHYKIITTLAKGKTYPVILAQSYGGWYAIRLSSGTVGYISADYVKLSFDMDTGLTLKEIARMRDLENLEAALNLEPGDGARVEANMLKKVNETKRTPVSMTEDEIYLLATIIYTEAGNQKYEGMLAVANVILNRMENGHWGKTLNEVIFAPGQFAGAAPELIARAQSKGIPEICYKAAREAIAGRNNIGNFLFFRTTRTAYKSKDYAKYTKFYILEDHVFYEKKW